MSKCPNVLPGAYFSLLDKELAKTWDPLFSQGEEIKCHSKNAWVASTEKRNNRPVMSLSVSRDNLMAWGHNNLFPHWWLCSHICTPPTSKSKRQAVSFHFTSACVFAERREYQDIDAISCYLCLVSFLSKTCCLIYSLQYFTFCTDQSCRAWKNI